MDIILRELQISDLDDYLKWKNPSREFHKFNGPYYKIESEKELEELVDNFRKKLLQNKRNVLECKKIIANKKTNEIIGEVNWYWKSEETFWMEIGLVIFNENYWGKGIGAKVLKMWTTEIFKKRPKLVRLGLSTWSGNDRMIGLAKKLGFKEEARFRKARIVDDRYYDSVSYGILREEWAYF